MFVIGYMKKRSLVKCVCGLAAAVLFSGCIKNDIPYAKVPLSIVSMQVEGQIGNAVISEDDRTVTLTLGETVNPSSLKVTEFTCTDKASSTLSVGQEINLSSPYKVTLSLYQDYEWTVVRSQPVERTFQVENQVGNATFDEVNLVARALIRKDADLSEFSLLALKLGPEGSAMNGEVTSVPTLKWTLYANYAEASVRVTYGGFVDQIWRVRVYNSSTNVITESADGWVNVGWMYGTGVAGADCGFEYREVGAAEWIRVPQEYLTVDGGEFRARVPHLDANATYECRAYSGEEYADAVEFSTVDVETVPNMDFEDWVYNAGRNGKSICPWAEGGSPFWDTGNHGSTTLSDKDNVTTPVSDPRPGSRGTTAAQLKSATVVGVLAAGNLFIGEYKETVGMNGRLGFGRGFTSYPTRLKGYFKYQTAPITKVNAGFEFLESRPDSCIVWVALGDWELSSANSETGQFTAVEILTDNANNNGTYFDKNDSHIIAYGEMVCGENVSDYREFSVELDYRATNRRPTALLIVCSASKYGDYFTGGPGATLWLDDFSLEYDYD